jgi:two-component system, OmpR family, sensor histidine kinase KdpD
MRAHLPQPEVRRVALTVIAVGGVTLLFARVVTVNPTTAGFVYLITVLLIAARWGRRESLIASLAATLCFNYFFMPPVGTFSIAAPHNWVALFAFLATALIASQLSERARRRTKEAIRRQDEVERLYALSRAILLSDPERSFSQAIAEQVRNIYSLDCVAVLEAGKEAIHISSGEDAPADLQKRLDDALHSAATPRPSGSAYRIVTIKIGDTPVAALAVRGGSVSADGLQALANLLAVGFERSRAQAAAARAEAARETQEFKSTLLDSLAHELQTPLTSIKGATSAILSNGVSREDHRRELLTVIDQDADRLTSLVKETIQLARIDAGKIAFERRLCSLNDVVDHVKSQMEVALEGRTVNVALESDIPPVFIDGELVQLALKQLIDNAIKYSPHNSVIEIRMAHADHTACVTVRNEGAPLAEHERDRIFERYYRGERTQRQVMGSGMGLAIARDILRAHGGDLRVDSRQGATEFTATLPLYLENNS